MNGIDRIAANLESHLTITLLSAAAAIIVACGAIWGVRSARRRGLTGEQAGTLLAAAIATGVSAQGMWVFFDKSLHLTLSLRIMFFAFLEIMVLTSALRARSTQRVSGSAGIDGVAMWVLTCLSAVLAATDADNAGTVLIRLSAPLVAAWGWERSMALERRRSGALGGINWRITPERILIRLGIADPTDRTAGEAARQRRLIDVALAADHARTLRETGAGAWRINRARRHLQRVMRRAVEDGGLVDNARSPRTVLMDNLRVLSGTGALVDLDLPSPWTFDDDAASGMFLDPRSREDRGSADHPADPIDTARTHSPARDLPSESERGQHIPVGPAETAATTPPSDIRSPSATTQTDIPTHSHTPAAHAAMPGQPLPAAARKPVPGPIVPAAQPTVPEREPLSATTNPTSGRVPATTAVDTPEEQESAIVSRAAPDTPQTSPGWTPSAEAVSAPTEQLPAAAHTIQQPQPGPPDATPPASEQSEPAQANRQYRRDPAFRERVRELHAINTSTSEIAAQLGTSARTIRRIIADLDAESDTSGTQPRNPAQAAVSNWHNGFRVLPGGNSTAAAGTRSADDDPEPHRTDRSMEK